MDDKIKFKGNMKRCIYKSDNFGVYAFDVDTKRYPEIVLNSYKNCTVIGDLPDLTEDVEYDIVATTKESKYGLSYEVVQIKRNTPTTKEETYSFLREVLTENQAKVLIENYPNIIQLVKENRTHIIDVKRLKGIGEKSLEKIKDKIVQNFYLLDLVAEFGNVISLSMLNKIYNKYSSIEVLKKKLITEPYTTLTRVSGIGFKKADAIVLELQEKNIMDFGCDIRTSENRCLSCMLYLLEENETNGNTKMNIQELRSQCLKLIPECANHFTNAIKNIDIYYSKETMDVALRQTYDDEKYIANFIKYGLSVNKKWDFDWKSYQNKGEFSLSDEQVELLHSVCENNVVILTGGAGMGKSASTKMLIQMLEDNNKTYVLAAPTGKSAKVLKDFSKTEAKTIHRALEYNPKTGWGYDRYNKIDCDVFLIDEISMVSIELMSRVIDAIDFERTKLVMIGDPNQLPSVQCGNILFDFLASNIIPVVRLTKVFRYGTGGILTAATDIIRGNQYIPNDNRKIIPIGDDGGYTFIKSDDKSIIGDAISLYKKLITTGVDGCIYKPEEIAVLTAYNKGDYGAVTLNTYLQKIANKNYGSEHCFKHGSSVYYIDDIVMQRVNNYAMQIYKEEDEEAFVANGECSKVTLINKEFIVSDFDDIRIKYYKDDLTNLSLSYSYTIHKSQGSTIKIVIVISPRSHIYMSSSNLLYVGVTRASDKCYHLGLPSTINIAMKKKENFNRATFMQEMLKENNK